MASIRQKTGSKFWYACFTDLNGRRTQRSTETTDRKLAKKLAEEFEETAQKKRTEAQVRQVMSDIHERIHGSAISAATVDSFYLQWTARKQGEVAPTTFAAYKAVVGEFVKYLGPKASQPIQYLVAHDVAKWRDSMVGKTSATTTNNKLKIVRVFLESAWRENLSQENPAAKVKTLKTSSVARRPFKLHELQAALRVATGEWRGIVLFGAYTGQRLRDIALITLSQIDRVRGEWRFQTSKTGRTQIIPLHSVLIKYLEESSTRNYASYEK